MRFFRSFIYLPTSALNTGVSQVPLLYFTDTQRVITFLQTGTHWLSEIIDYVLSEGSDDFDRAHLSTALETTMELDPAKIGSGTPGYTIYEKMKSPRVVGTHCTVNLLPPQVWQKKPKVQVTSSVTS